MLYLIKCHFYRKLLLRKRCMFLNDINGLIRVNICTGQVLQVHFSWVNLDYHLQIISQFLLYFAEMSPLQPFSF